MKAPSFARLPSAQSACWSGSWRLGWLLSTAQTAAAPWSPHAGSATAASLLWTHLFTFIGKVDCPPSHRPGQISERHAEHRVFWAPAGGVHHPCPSAGCGAAAGVGHRALPCHPSIPECGEGQVGASSRPANPALGQLLLGEVLTLAPSLALALPLPNSPCLTQGGFSTGLGGGKDVKQAFP